MAFDQQSVFNPTSIGLIDHFLDYAASPSLQYRLQILDQFGDVMAIRSGNETPHLTPTQITQLQSFITTRRAALPIDLSFPAGHTLGRSTWRIRDGDGTNPSRSMYCRAIENDDLGQFVQVHIVNDQPNLSGPQVTALVLFMDTQRAKAVAEILA